MDMFNFSNSQTKFYPAKAVVSFYFELTFTADNTTAALACDNLGVTRSEMLKRVLKNGFELKE